MSMYGLLQANLASGLPAVTTEFMSEREYRSCWLASNVLHYLRNNINPLSGLAGRATEPLLRQIISDADSAFVILRRNQGARIFWTCRDSSPSFLTLMRLPGMLCDD